MISLDPHSRAARTAALALAALLPVAAGAVAPPSSSPPQLVDMDGRPFALESLKGSVVVLDFWAPWCAPCRKSFPFLAGLQARHARDGLRVVALTLDNDLAAVGAFLADVPATFPVVRDPVGGSGDAFGVVAMPTTLLLDRNGVVVARFEGGGDTVHRKLEDAVTQLLASGSLVRNVDVRVPASVAATGRVKAWERGLLADPIMSLDGGPLARMLSEHVHASKEAAAGDGGAAGGDCGCN